MKFASQKFRIGYNAIKLSLQLYYIELEEICHNLYKGENIIVVSDTAYEEELFIEMSIMKVGENYG